MNRISWIISFTVITALVLIFSNCGQPIPPTGGPRDSLPPVLVNSTPPDSTVQFKGDRIRLDFDEYIQLDNPQEKIIISPLPKITPVIQARLKTVTIRLKDTLEANTTYSINFGESLKDINENNPLKNFTYVFSTGDSLDTYQLGGRVLLASTGKADSTLIVVLHRSMEDSAVAKEKPRYMARINGKGFFNFRNLAPGTYQVFALKDVDGQRMYDQKSEWIGFIDRPVVVGDSSPALRLYAFSTEPEPPKPESGTAPAGGTPRGREDKRLRFYTNLDNNQQDILGVLKIIFERPAVTYDSSKLLLTNDQFQPLTGYSLSQDSTRKELNLSFPWIEDTKYNLVIEKDFASDSLGNSVTRTDTILFKTRRKSEYGSIKIIFSNLDTTQHPVFQLYQNDKPVLSAPVKSSTLNFPLFKPGDYEVRILYDNNENGIWDTGNYWEKKQPELVISRPERFNIRANFDNELSINLNELKN